jgi:hypothetical protein
LDAHLGISSSPATPIGAFLPATQAFDPSATGFYVYTFDLGTVTLPANSVENTPAGNAFLLTTSPGVPQGSYAEAFIEQSGAFGNNANSGAILETSSPPPVPEPSTWAMMLLGFVGLAYAGLRKTKGARISFA